MSNNDSPTFHKLVDEIRQLHNDKNADYAEAGNVWGNFDRVAHLMDFYGIWNANIPSRVKVALCYQLKQIDCKLNAWGKGKTMKVEGVKGRMMDIAVYELIQMALLEDENEST